MSQITRDEFEAVMALSPEQRLPKLEAMRGRRGLNGKALDQIIQQTRADVAGSPENFRLGEVYALGPKGFGVRLVEHNRNRQTVTFFYGKESAS